MFPLFNSHSAANHCYVAQPNCPHLIDYYGGPAKYLFILQPGYDPLSEYCALGAGSQANGGREIRPGWQALRDSVRLWQSPNRSIRPESKSRRFRLSWHPNA